MKMLRAYMVTTLMWAGVVEAAPAPITGQWFTEYDRAVVRIAPCGALVCGTLIARGPGMPREGAPVFDRNNHDVSLRNRVLIGLVLLPDASAQGDHWHGNIYSPDDGRSYPANFNLARDGTLRVRGCWGFICRTQFWKPAR